MGEVEKTFARKRKRADIQQLVLRSVAVAGLLSVAMLAPNVIGAMHKLGLTPSRRQKEIISAARKRLEEKGLLKRNTNGTISLTPKGELELEIIAAGLPRKKARRWDKRWRVLIFDIPEHRKGVRDKVRRMLTRIGYVRLQNSVWVYPYPTDEIIALLKADLCIGKDMIYMIVDTIENDRGLKKHFNFK